MSKEVRLWWTALVLGAICPWASAMVSEVAVLSLNNGVFVQPGERVAVARIEILDDGTGDRWQSLTVTNAGNNDGVQVEAVWDNGDGLFDPSDQPASPRMAFTGGEALLQIGRFDAGGAFINEGRATSGMTIAYVVLSTSAGAAGDLLDVSIGAGGFQFQTGATGPGDGYFGASGPYLAGVTEITLTPLSDNRYVPFGQRVEIVGIMLTANAGGDEWSSLRVVPASNEAKAISFTNLQLLRDSPELVGSEERFGTLDAEDVPIGTTVSFSTDEVAQFTNLAEPITGSRHYLLVATAGSVGKASQDDLLDVDLAVDSFVFANAGVTGTVYRGKQGPYVGNAPPTIQILQPDGQDDVADANYLIQYEAADPDSREARIALYAAPSQYHFLQEDIVAALRKLDENGEPVVSVEELNMQEGLTELILVASGISIETRPQVVEWRTVVEVDGAEQLAVKDGEYYIYGVIQDIIVEKKGEPNTRILRTDAARSTGVVKIEHVSGISQLSPAEDVLAADGTYLITWHDQKLGGDASIALYYSTDPDLDSVDAIRTQGTLIMDQISEDADGERGQYTWNLEQSKDAFVPSGIYYLYGIIGNGGTIEGQQWARSTGTVQVTHPPTIKLVSPIAQGSRGIDSFTISWLAQDVDDDAQIQLYYSRTDQSGDLAGFIDGIGAATNELGTINSSLLSEDSVGYYIWDVNTYEAEHGVNLAGSYYIYASIAEPDGVQRQLASAPGLLTLRRIDIRLHPSSIVAGTNEPFSVDVELNTHGIDISAASVYLNYNGDLLTVADQDVTKEGVQPFQQPPTTNALFNLVNTNKGVPENHVTGTTGTMHLTYSVMDLDTPYRSSEFTKLATLQFTVKAEGPATTTLGFEYDAAANRTTSVLTSNVFDDLSEISPVAPLPAMSIQIPPPATIMGRVQLQGRSDHGVQVTFDLRAPGSSEPYPDYAPASSRPGDGGDEDTATPGIQVTVRPDGSYQLAGVPAGRWELVAKATSYLRGQYMDPQSKHRTLQVVAGDTLQNIDILNRDEGAYLLGGDLNDDNRINISDFTALSNAFGTTLAANESNTADINADRRVSVTDFAILAQNFGEIGIPPTMTDGPPQTGAPETMLAGRSVAFEAPSVVQHAEIFEATIPVPQGAPLQGYELELSYDPTAVELLAESGYQVSQDSLRIRQTVRDGTRSTLILAEVGRGAGTLDERTLVIPFRALKAGVTEIQLRSMAVVRSGKTLTFPGSRRTVALMPRATRTQLHANYPNPFNPETWIPYELARASEVSLSIFDGGGRLVREIRLGNRPSGVYTDRSLAIYWDGRNDFGERVSSGMYFYQLRTGTDVFTRRMLLVK